MSEHKLIQVKDYADLRRDSSSKGIVNVSTEKLNDAKFKKKTVLEQKNHIKNLEERINSMETKLDKSIEKFEQIIQLLGEL